MPVKDYSTTANSNAAIAGINIAENCPAGNLNNALRQALADLRSYANGAEWFEYGDGDGAAAVTYLSGTSFAIAGTDVAGAWHSGRRVKASGSSTGTIYGVIASSSFATNTTVTVAWDSGSLQNESLTVWLGILSATNGAVPSASMTARGAVELATTAETLAGTDTGRAVTPDAMAAFWERGGDIASAGTISIGEGGYFHVTGTTTITDIDFATDKAGRHAWLIFDGVLTLTHNATTLILPGGANITTAAGDACLVVSEDGSENVRVPIYSRKDGAPAVPPTQVITKSFTSADTSIAQNSSPTFAHGFGALPKLVQFYLVCQSADGNYASGDVIQVTPHTIQDTGSGSGAAQFGAYVDTTNITVIAPNTTAVFKALDKTTRGQFFPDLTKWKLRVVAFA
jgi:hypothetical protein